MKDLWHPIGMRNPPGLPPMKIISDRSFLFPALAGAVLIFNPQAAQADILLTEDFSTGDGGFLQTSDGLPENPWIFDVAAAAWATDGDANGTPTNHYLTAPSSTIPSPLPSPPVVRVTFVHRYSIETDWDAGVLQLKVNAGAFATVPNSEFTQNGYTNTQGLLGAHALTGGDGFTANSLGVGAGTTITSIVEMQGLTAGDELTFRFLAAFDQGAKGATLPNWEISSVTVETLNDNDGDGLPNDYEARYPFLDPDDPADASADQEPDGLTNLQEFDRGTLPDDPDTDDDELPDGVETGTGIWVSEADRGTDPLNPDSDEDGLLDGVENHALPYDSQNPETQPGSDPNLANTDGDFASDANEVAFNTDPTDATKFPPFTEFLQFRYNFDNEGAGPLVDTSGKANLDLLTPSNGPAHRYGQTSLTGGAGFSIGLDAPGDGHTTGSYLLLRDAPHPETFSFSLWVKPNKPGEQNPILSRENVWWPSPGVFYSLFVNPEGGLTWITGQTETIVTDPGLITDGQVHHIVVTHLDTDGRDTFTADRARLYLDGVMVGEVENPTEIPSLESSMDASNIYRNIWLGTRSSGPGFKGELDDFQCYSTELDEDQVANMFADPGSIAPFVPVPPFAITEIIVVGNPEGGNDVSITWNSTPRDTYSLDFWSSQADSWDEVSDSIGGAEGLTTTYTFREPEATRRIYRVRREG